ncbi:flagellar outer dynein arm heavy chain gamma [Toxoplasma gondii COUG]|uniref:Flagellar outer dynein arm heavy chain gamma n=1 Tax=Toxoplasma gondii COUG TaxID=1074873 RepID=A0A2G8XMM7_TOXGO|nr:flagellar outer dynein arm heavy chain gamma [Toxoplasma gondii COUG]
MPRGSAMLVGVGGSGKQSLARLAAYIAGHFTFQITVTKTYNDNALFDDLRCLYASAGQKNQATTFLLTDLEIKSEGFLEYFNSLLSTGEVAGLFAKDERDSKKDAEIHLVNFRDRQLRTTETRFLPPFYMREVTDMHLYIDT